MSNKEQFRKKLEEERELQKSFKIDLNSVYKKITTGSSDSDNDQGSGSTKWNDRDYHNVGGKVIGPETQHLNWDTVFSNLGIEKQEKTAKKEPSTQSNSDFSPIIKQLSKFSFSKDENQRKQQILKISSNLNETLVKMAMSNIASATKQVYANMEKFTYINNGNSYTVKAVFDVKKTKVLVEASGDFDGSEIVCLEAKNGLEAYIVKEENDEIKDVTSNYKIKLSKMG